ncbi:DUF1508 domain-containing protein [Halorientalis brevis]|uniref:DUF1508 domain-containing protein n=1 Tax=Halorientalis brevis TaxID=1126241 RepID=UPI001FF7EB66|nr:DUF1508 domain-containing protein [Halorientalis brevis]
MATGSQPDSIFYGVYDKYVGEARTKPEVYGYWILVLGLLAVVGGVGLFLTGRAVDVGVSAAALRKWAIGLGASGGVGLLLGSVLQLPLRRQAITVAVAGAVCSLVATLVFVQIYPEAWAFGTTTESVAVVVAYVGGLGVVALVAALVPVVTGRRSLLLAEEPIETLAWTAEDDTDPNVSAVLHGEETRDGVFAVFRGETGWRWWFVEQTAVADGQCQFETPRAAETALEDVRATVQTAGLLEVTHAAIRLYTDGDAVRWSLVDDDGVVLAESADATDGERAEEAVNLLKEHGPGAALLDADDGAFEVYGNGSAWQWRLVDETRGVLGTGATEYEDRATAESAVVAVREAIQSAPVMDVEQVGFERVEREDGWTWRLLDAADTTVAEATGSYQSRASVTDAISRVVEGAIDVPFVTATAPGYEIVQTENGGWTWRLVDDTDEVVARSEQAVPSEESGRSVVSRVKDIVADPTVAVLDDAEYELFQEGDGWAWRLVTEDRRALARSPPSDHFETPEAASAAVDRVSEEIERAERVTFDSSAFHLYEADGGAWNWRLVDADGRVVSDSGQQHASREDAASAMNTMKEHAPEADMVEIDSPVLECYEAASEWHWRLVDATGDTLATSPGRHDSNEAVHEVVDALALLAPDAPVRTMDAGLFHVYVSDTEPRRWRWQLVHPDGTVVARSVEGYPSQEAATDAADAVAEYAADATVHTIADLAIRFDTTASESEGAAAPPDERWYWDLIDSDRERLAVGTEQFPSRDAVAATARLVRDHASAASVFEIDPAAFRLDGVDDEDGNWRWRLIDADRTTLAVGDRTHDTRESARAELDRVRDLASGAGLLGFDLAGFEFVQREGGWEWQFVDTAGTVLGVSGPSFDTRPAAERALAEVRDRLTDASVIEIESPAFELHAEDGDWRWRLVDTDGSTIAESMRQYPTRREVRDALDSLREYGPDAATELAP